MTKFKFWLFFVSILVLGIFLRIYKFGQIPESLYWDEVAIFLDARSVAQTGLDIHGRPWFQLMYPSYGDYKLPVYIWFSAISIKFLGANDWVIRVPSLLAGIGTIITIGLIASKLFSSKKAQVIQLCSMLVVAISPWAITFSRTGFEGNVAQFFVGSSVLTLLFSFESKGRKKWLLLLLSVGLGVLATYTYFSVRFVWPIVFVLIQMTYFKHLYKTNKLTKTLVKLVTFVMLPLIVYLALLVPMINSEFYAESNRFRLSAESVLNHYDFPLEANHYRELAGNTIVDRLFFHRYWLLVQKILGNMSRHVSIDFLFINGDTNLRHGTTQFGLFLLPFLPVLLVGCFYLFDKHKTVLLALIGWWLVALVPASVPVDVPHALRSLNALTPLSLLIGFGLFKIISSKQRLLTLVLGVAISLCLIQYQHFYVNVYPHILNEAWLDGYKESAAYYWQYIDAVDQFYWQRADDKFYLWLLAYGPLSSTQIQQMPTRNFLHLPDNFKKITYTSFKENEIDTNGFQKIVLLSNTIKLIDLHEQQN